MLAPSFALDHASTPQAEVPLLGFLKSAEENLVATFELLMAHLCGRHCQGFAGMPLWVVPIEESKRRNKHIRYGYVTKMGDQLVPFG